jgi:hypothetical protein
MRSPWLASMDIRERNERRWPSPLMQHSYSSKIHTYEMRLILPCLREYFFLILDMVARRTPSEQRDR